jgi:predicted aconitase with swiveling domain
MSARTIIGDPVVPGDSAGPVRNLERPLSFWGGVDPQTGRVTDVHHPQHGLVLTGRVVVMPAGRGSSSSSSALLECVRAGTAPAALLMHHVDPILPVGAAVAIELYGRGPAVVRIDAAERLPDGAIAHVTSDGAITVDDSTTGRGPAG